MRAAAFIFYVKSFNFNKQCFRRLVSLQKQKIRARILNLRLRDTTRLKSAIKGHKKQLLSFRLKSDILPLKKNGQHTSCEASIPSWFYEEGIPNKGYRLLFVSLIEDFNRVVSLKKPVSFFYGPTRRFEKSSLLLPSRVFFKGCGPYLRLRDTTSKRRDTNSCAKKRIVIFSFEKTLFF